MCKIWSIFILTCLYHLIYGQSGYISGTVSDQSAPLAYANILFNPGNIGVSTDDQGMYELANVSPGTYTLKVSFVGYESINRKVLINENQNLSLNFEMQQSAALEEIVITGTMRPTYVSDSPIKVDVITARQLETFIPSAASSVVEGVQLVNGVQEVVACGVCYTNNISINGLNGAYTSILMDGTPMYGNLASVYGLNGIPNMIIERFEVIKGPSSTLYGSEAVAGVINIITKDPSKQPWLSLDIMGTSHHESFGNIAAAPRIGKSNGYIGLNYAYVNDFDDNNNDHFGDAVLLDRYSLFTKWDISRQSKKKFSISGKYYYEDRRNGVEEYIKNRNYRTLRGSDKIYGESIYTNRAEIFGTYEFNVPINLKLDFSLSNHDQNSYYGSDYYKADQKIAYTNFIWNIEANNHSFVIGATQRYNAYDDNTVATERQEQNGTIINSPDNQFIPGLFIQDEMDIGAKWTLLSGARLDHFSKHGLIFSPRLNVKFEPSEWTTIRSNIGTGFRTVNLFTEDHAFVTGQRTVEITETLEPEKSVNVSLNINHVFAAIGGSGSIDLEGYYTYFSNKILPDYTSPGIIRYGNSDGNAKTMGIGLNLNYTFVFPLSINVGASIQSATETDYLDNNTKLVKDIEYAPKSSGIISANYTWRKAKLTLAYTARHTGVMELPEVYDVSENGELMATPRPTKSDPFALHNFQMNKVLTDAVTIYMGIQNLTNFRQLSSPLVGYNDPNASIGFSDYFDTSYAYAPNHGREVYLGVKWDLKKKK